MHSGFRESKSNSSTVNISIDQVTNHSSSQTIIESLISLPRTSSRTVAIVNMTTKLVIIPLVNNLSQGSEDCHWGRCSAHLDTSDKQVPSKCHNQGSLKINEVETD